MTTDTIMYGPAAWEGPVRAYGPVDRAAVLSDVHANIPALDAVLAQVAACGVDLVVFNGDLTWGVEPELAVAAVRDLGDRALCVRGNGERFVLGLAVGEREPRNARDVWISSRHTAPVVDLVAAIPFSVRVEVRGLGVVRFCHGSPRSDHEVVTPATPPERIAELSAAIDEPTLVTGHTHMQFDRSVAGRRSVNPGSVGLPFHHGEPGTAYWALLGPDVELRQTAYDVTESIARAERAGDPGAETYSSLLLTPPTPEQITSEVECLIFSD
jgi:putative phosphoesterase